MNNAIVLILFIVITIFGTIFGLASLGYFDNDLENTGNEGKSITWFLNDTNSTNSTITEVKYEINWDSSSKSYQLKINESEIPNILEIPNDNIICWQGIPYRSYFGSDIELLMDDDVPELNGWQLMIINNTSCFGDRN